MYQSIRNQVTIAKYKTKEISKQKHNMGRKKVKEKCKVNFVLLK